MQPNQKVFSVNYSVLEDVAKLIISGTRTKKGLAPRFGVTSGPSIEKHYLRDLRKLIELGFLAEIERGFLSDFVFLYPEIVLEAIEKARAGAKFIPEPNGQHPAPVPSNWIPVEILYRIDERLDHNSVLTSMPVLPRHNDFIDIAGQEELFFEVDFVVQRFDAKGKFLRAIVYCKD